jgi:hypothetical protein
VRAPATPRHSMHNAQITSGGPRAAMPPAWSRHARPPREPCRTAPRATPMTNARPARAFWQTLDETAAAAARAVRPHDESWVRPATSVPRIVASREWFVGRTFRSRSPTASQSCSPNWGRPGIRAVGTGRTAARGWSVTTAFAKPRSPMAPRATTTRRAARALGVKTRRANPRAGRVSRAATTGLAATLGRGLTALELAAWSPRFNVAERSRDRARACQHQGGPG